MHTITELRARFRGSSVSKRVLVVQPAFSANAYVAHAHSLGWEVLDRVLCGESSEAFVAAEGGGEAEEGQVVAGM
ncbi:hypothetical protein, partial [Streptomyces diastaticus]